MLENNYQVEYDEKNADGSKTKLTIPPQILIRTKRGGQRRCGMLSHFLNPTALSKEVLLDIMTGLQNRNSYKECSSTPKVSCFYIDKNGLHEINNYLGIRLGIIC